MNAKGEKLRCQVVSSLNLNTEKPKGAAGSSKFAHKTSSFIYSGQEKIERHIMAADLELHYRV